MEHHHRFQSVRAGAHAAAQWLLDEFVKQLIRTKSLAELIRPLGGRVEVAAVADDRPFVFGLTTMESPHCRVGQIANRRLAVARS